MALTKVEKVGASKDLITEGWDKFNDLIDDLLSTSSGLGASTIGIQDSAGNMAATDVEAALAEIYTDIASGTSFSNQFDEDDDTTTGTTWGYQAGLLRETNAVTAIAKGTIGLTDDSANYVEIDSSGVVSKNTTQFTDGKFALREITVASGAQTVSTDKRAFFDLGNVSVAQGGTGVATLTDGGVLLGSGTSAVTVMAVLADGEMIVGDGATDPVAESGATLRTSIGIGTGDSPQFTGIELGHATDTTLTRASAADVNIEGNIIYRAGGTDVAVADGGTGRSTSTTAYGLLAAGTTATGAHQTLAAGLTTQILVGGGAAALPAWGTDIPTAVTIGTAYIYRTGGTDVPVTDGGTGASTLADGGLVIGNAGSAVEVVAAGATTEILVGGGATTAPVWTTATGTGAPVRATSPTFVTSIIMGSATLGETELEILDGATLTTTQINYLNAATGTTGTTNTNVVFSTSPTLVTPALGTPSALVGTNISGTGASFTAGSATILETARTIGGVSFNGSANITVASATGGFAVSGGSLTLASQTVTGAGTISVTDAAGPTILNEAATSTNPTLIPNKAETDTGIGWVSADIVDIITGGAERARFSAAGVLIPDGHGMVIGATTQQGVGGITAEFQVLGTASSDSSMGLGRWSNGIDGPLLTFYHSRDTSIGGLTAVTSGDQLGEIRAYGDDGTDNATLSSYIEFDTEGTIAAGRVPGMLKFFTGTDAASTVATLALTLNSSQNALFAGNVRIGGFIGAETSPLQIKSDASHHGISIEENNGGEDWQLGVDASGALVFYDSESIAVTFADGGGVLVGTGSLTEQVTIGSLAAVGLSMFSDTDNTPADNDVKIVMGTHGTTGTWTFGLDASLSDAFVFANSDSSLSTNPRLHLTTAGNMGLGVTPLSEFHIGQDAHVVMTLGNVANNAGKEGVIRQLQYAHTSEPEGYTLIGGYGPTGDNQVLIGGGFSGYNAAKDLFFYTAANETTRTGTIALTIDSAQNMGLGVTPEAWDSTYRALQIGGNASLSASPTAGASAYFNISLNAYYDDVNNRWEYISTDEASAYYQAGGKHFFRVAASGTADAAISWTTALTIDNSGNSTFGGDAFIGNGHGLVIGATSQQSVMGATPELQVLGAGLDDSAIGLGRWSDDGGVATVRLYKSRNAAIGSNTAVTSGDGLGQVLAYGDDGTDGDTLSSYILFDTEGTIGTGRVPGMIKMYTGTDAAPTVATLALTLDSAQLATFAGNIVIPDAGTIGSASDTDAIAISSGGDITLTQDIVMASGKLIGITGDLDLITLTASTVTVAGAVTATGAISGVGMDAGDGVISSVGDIELDSISNEDGTLSMTVAASTGIVTFNGNIIIPDAGNIGSATSTSAVTIASTGRMTFANTVGIGATPEDWLGPAGNFVALQVGGLAGLSQNPNQIASSSFNITNNARYDETDSRWEFIINDEATQYEQINGSHHFKRAGVGAADAAITFSTIFTVGTNVYVGTTPSPNLGLGTASFGTSGTAVLSISADGTVPSSSPAGVVQIFADDSSDGAANATLAIRTEQAVESGAMTPSHKLKIWVNGTEYWMSLDAV